MATTPPASAPSTDDLLASLASEEIDRLLAEDAADRSPPPVDPSELVDPPAMLQSPPEAETEPDAKTDPQAAVRSEVAAQPAAPIEPGTSARESAAVDTPVDDLVDAVMEAAEVAAVSPKAADAAKPARPGKPAEPAASGPQEPRTGEADGEKFIVVKDGAWRTKPTVAPGLIERDPTAAEPEALVDKQSPVPQAEAQGLRLPGERDPTPAEDLRLPAAETDNSAVTDSSSLPAGDEAIPAPVEETAEESNEVVADLSALEEHVASSDLPLVTAPDKQMPTATAGKPKHIGPPMAEVPADWKPPESALDVLSSLSEPEIVRWVWLRRGLEVLARPLDALSDRSRDLIGKIAIVTLFNGTAVLLYVYFVRGS
jgi:hypothetical protein